MKLSVLSRGVLWPNTDFEIDVKLEDTVADVKKNIEDVYPAAEQVLLHRGEELKDGTTLEENGVAENSFFVVLLSKGIPEAAEVPPVAGVPPVPAVNPPVQAPQATQPAAAPLMDHSNFKFKSPSNRTPLMDKSNCKSPSNRTLKSPTLYQRRSSFLSKKSPKFRKVATANNMPPPSTRAEKPRTIEQVREKFGRIPISVEIAFQVGAALQKSYYPHLKDEHCMYKALEGRLEKEYGDYMSYNILRICEILRSKDPKRHKKTTPKTIAKEIVANFEKSEIIRELKVVDIGYITFRLNGEWMLKRIQKNLKDNMVAWAPIAHARRAIVDSPTQDIDAEMRADCVRSSYIRDTLVNMLEYSGVKVSSSRMVNEQSLCVAKEYFPEEGKGIRKKGETESLFDLKEEASHKAEPNNVHMDLAALWCGIYEQKADWIVYVTPVRQRDYITKCFGAAEGYYEDKIFGAHRDFNNEDKPTMSYVGYQTSSEELGKLILSLKLFKSFLKQSWDILVKEGIAAGYSDEEFFECAIKYDYLKTHRCYDCPLLVQEEIFKYKRNTLLHLLKTRIQIRSVLKNSPTRDMFKLNEALVGRERETGLHLLQFTEVIDEAFLTCMPHLLCEYLFKLSNNITSYIDQAKPSGTKLLLCKAAEVVMEKGFDLLGITPESSKGLPWYLKLQSGKDMANRDQYISLPVFSPHPSSRFEIFSMHIEVYHENFDSGDLFGRITLSDDCALLSDGWCKFDENGCGHVALFSHDFNNSIGIRDTHFFSLENPGSRHAVPFSDSIKMGVHLYVTTKRKDACYQLSSGDHPIDLKDFWQGEESIQRNCFYAKSDHGSVSIYYILIKDALDTSWSLAYKPTNGAPKLTGHIIASYASGVVGGNNMSFEAVMFHVELSKLMESENLNLRRSVLAVPSNGVLIIRALIQDVDSKEYIVNETHEYPMKPENSIIRWPMKGKNCFFELTVDLVEAKSSIEGGTEYAVCINCLERGHLSKDCPKKREYAFCLNCLERGHPSKDCPEKRMEDMNSLI